MENRLKVLFVVAECSPFVKVGGLGDVAGELPLKLKELGVDVRIVIPANKDIAASTFYVGDYPVNLGWRTETCIVREVLDAPVKTYLIDNYHYLGRSGVYGHRDDSDRFAFFCLSVYEMIRRFDFKPDVLHLNDWHTAPLAMIIRENEREHKELSEISILYTIHNLEYQGVSSISTFNLFGVKDIVFKTDKVEYFGCFNAMKAGINYADIINSVSKTSAQQMLTYKYGFGLEGVISKRKASLRGIVNGINTINWNPESDKLIYATYSKENLKGKKENKARLQTALGLKSNNAPLFSVISRLVPEKGLDLMERAAEEILRMGGQFILLGSGEKFYENAFLRLVDRYKDSVSINFEYNNEKAHKIYAGSDVLLMPSRYEPCGLSQLIAMKYGTIPVVHKTGGLADTVIDEDTSEGQGTGFVFQKYSLHELIKALKSLFELYKKEEAWTDLRVRAMSRDSSWDCSAKEYISLYNEAQMENENRKNKERKALD